MYLIVGLGNPESEYAHTRHNMGFDVINKLSAKYEIEVKKEKFNGLFGSGVIEGKKVILLKPQTFMNASGECVEKFAKFYKIEAKDIITIFDDIDIETVERFKLLAKDRVPSIEQETDILALMKRLNLVVGGRAAVVLFGKNVQKYVLQARIKIGKFLSETEVLTTDIIEGNLIQQVDRALDILRTKYLLSYISYEGIHRREKLVYPYEALREALLNSIIHREYFVSSEIQIRIYDDKLVMGNEARLQDITVEDLSRPHPSRPHNKLIADVFYKAGFIESWGRGTQRIIDNCVAEGLSAPVYEYKMGFLYLTFMSKQIVESPYVADETLRPLGETLRPLGETLRPIVACCLNA